jgi:hypothetical protein
MRMVMTDILLLLSTQFLQTHLHWPYMKNDHHHQSSNFVEMNHLEEALVSYFPNIPLLRLYDNDIIQYLANFKNDQLLDPVLVLRDEARFCTTDGIDYARSIRELLLSKVYPYINSRLGTDQQNFYRAMESRESNSPLPRQALLQKITKTKDTSGKIVFA